MSDAEKLDALASALGNYRAAEAARVVECCATEAVTSLGKLLEFKRNAAAHMLVDACTTLLPEVLLEVRTRRLDHAQVQAVLATMSFNASMPDPVHGFVARVRKACPSLQVKP